MLALGLVWILVWKISIFPVDVFVLSICYIVLTIFSLNGVIICAFCGFYFICFNCSLDKRLKHNYTVGHEDSLMSYGNLRNTFYLMTSPGCLNITHFPLLSVFYRLSLKPLVWGSKDRSFSQALKFSLELPASFLPNYCCRASPLTPSEATQASL